jgi:hypothetical protein
MAPALPRWLPRARAALLALAIACAAARPAAAAAAASPGFARPPLRLVLTAGVAAPDCYPKRMILVNGRPASETAIEVEQGALFEVEVVNDIADDFPMLAGATGGVTIHWRERVQLRPWSAGRSRKRPRKQPTSQQTTHSFPTPTQNK